MEAFTAILIMVGIALGMMALWAVFASLPALIVMSAWNWLAPQFGSHVHLGFWQAWVGLFAIGIVGRLLRGSSK